MQRKTQSPTFWQEQFELNRDSVDLIYNQIVEENRILALNDLALALIQHYYKAEEQELISRQDGRIYRPTEQFAVGDKVVFPQFNFETGIVESVRAGKHPQYEKFNVISVSFKTGQAAREFVADFEYDHPLNQREWQSLADLQGVMSPEEIYQKYGKIIRAKIKAALKNHTDFVDFHDSFFLKDLLPDFHEGLFNIADAAIDINSHPLDIDNLIEQMQLAKEQEITEITRFSVNYHLANDARFSDVGPLGQVAWYLKRLQPEDAEFLIPRLEIKQERYNSAKFSQDLRNLLAEIDDEFTNLEDISAVGLNTEKVTILLNHPHWRSGTLPITPKTASFFPTSRYNHVLFEFVDGRTGNAFPAWKVLNSNYVFGLNQWYKKNKLPVGAYLTLQRTDNPLRVIINFRPTRTQRGWVRQASVVDNKLIFKMMPEAIGCEYDELMMVGEANSVAIDTLWTRAKERNTPVFEVLCHVFAELAKLNPQSTVHVKTLYTAVNIIRRGAPGVIFQELVNHACFTPMNNGYWSYNPNAAN